MTPSHWKGTVRDALILIVSCRRSVPSEGGKQDDDGPDAA